VTARRRLTGRPVPVIVAGALAVAATACSGSLGPPNGPGPTGGSTATGSNPPGPHRHLVVTTAPFRLPEALQREVAAAVDGSVLVAGGLDSAGSSTDGVIGIDPASGSVRSLGTLPDAFHDAAGAAIGGRVFVFGGGQGQGTDVVQSVDPTGSGAAVVGRLPVAVSDIGAAAVGRTVVLVGGYDGSTFLRDVFATTDGRSFRRLATLPVGLRYAAVAAIGHSVVVAGGLTTAGPVNEVLRIDLPGGRIHRLPPLPHPVAHAAAVAIGGLVYVLGGEGPDGQTVARIIRIDPRAGTVRVLHRRLPGTVADAAAVGLPPDSALLIGGRRGPQGHDVALDTILRLRLAG
jgi:Kelch motif